jgi:predicted metal-dependent hydrolase
MADVAPRRCTAPAMTDPSTAPAPLPAAHAGGGAPRLPVRRLRIDLSAGFGPLWCGGDAFRTHYLNALSMSFPVGEQFFIDSVKQGVATLPPEARARFADAVAGFVGQEATHRFLHARFNEELARQGLKNRWEGWAAWRIERGKYLPAVNLVAVTAAYEHYTAVLARGLLVHPAWLEGAEPDLALLWRWHAVEECEHKAVALDVYRAMGGGEGRRAAWFVYVSLVFFVESSLQTFLNLRRTGLWRRPRTWAQALRFLFGRDGLYRVNARPLAGYLRRGFHPADSPDAPEMARWLEAQRERYSIVGA